MNSKHNNKKSNIENSTNFIFSDKVFIYSILVIVFFLTSFLSLLFIHHHFGNNISFLSLKFLSRYVSIKLILLLIVYFLFDSLRLFFILKTFDIYVNFIYLLKLVFINIFTINITPFASGGVISQIYFLNAKGVPLGYASATTTIKSVLPIIFFFISTPLILLTNKNLIGICSNNVQWFYITFIILIYTVVIYSFYRIIHNTKIVKRIVYNLLSYLQSKKIISHNKAKHFLYKSFAEIDSFARSIRIYAKGNNKYIFLSIIFTILFLISLYNIFRLIKATYNPLFTERLYIKVYNQIIR